MYSIEKYVVSSLVALSSFCFAASLWFAISHSGQAVLNAIIAVGGVR